MDYKEFWIETFGDLEEELGREPSPDEMQSAWESYMEGIRGCYEDS